MKHLRLILAPLVMLAFALPANAEKLSLAEISGYLNKMTAAEAEFTQVNDDGTISTGKIYHQSAGPHSVRVQSTGRQPGHGRIGRGRRL